MVQVLRPPVHKVRSLLQDPLRLLRSTSPSPKTYVTQGYALIDYAQSRLAQAQLNQIQHRHQLRSLRVRQLRRVPTLNESQAGRN